MLHHVSVGVQDVARAATFYDPVLATLGYKRVADFSPGAIGYGEREGRALFWIGLPHNKGAASVGNGTHVGFVARSKEAVNAFHEAALKAGGSNNGEPGPRADYGPDYYGAFIYDLDGNKIEATLVGVVPGGAAGAARTPEEKAARKAARQAERAAAGAAGGEKKGKAGKQGNKGNKEGKAGNRDKKAKRAEKRAKKKAKQN